ncbi:MAG: 16S rRNA (cytosine(1402)-N(4))-methyltransferase RsmH, partial [bacterium]|nr:16S rRNA (cytosine(1402)-N(4))-methyltransferase RsmH [bacterium]
GFHKPVFLKEAIDFLAIKPGKKYIDATLGGGGHTLEILKRGGEVLGIDCDEEAISYVKEELKREKNGFYCPKTILTKSNFSGIEETAKSFGFEKVAGIIFDLGVSGYQLETPGRGFSFLKDEDLDMRMDKDLSVTAKDLINGLSKGELYELFQKLGEERHFRPIVRAVIGARRLTPIKTGKELARIVERAVGRRGKINPATRVFQALRIAVNDELNNLRLALPQALRLLDKDGRLVVIAFHSLEDRIVKNFFKEKECDLKILTKKVVRPTVEEITTNPRSRSARLRAAEKE